MAMKIVYVDEPTYLNTEFISELSKRGTVELHFDRPTASEINIRLAAADVVISEWSHFTKDTIPKNGRLKHIALLLSGLDTVDLIAASESGVHVSNCPLYCSDAVADHVITCAYALARRLPASARAGLAGVSHVYTPFLGRDLRGATIGLIGIGNIGRAVAERAAQIGMKIIGCNRSKRAVPGVEIVSIERLVAESDVVSVQLPYNDETHGIIDNRLLSLAKYNSFWINTGRFNLFCGSSLIRTLQEQRLGGIALDDCPRHVLGTLRSHGNSIVTPGTAWYTVGSREQNLREVITNIDRVAAGGRYDAL